LAILSWSITLDGAGDARQRSGRPVAVTTISGIG